ncbi:hypothetical protein SHIRM173S_07534 [Streptomyces hirsutus]
MAADDPFEVHPEVAVVVLVLVPGAGSTGHDGAAAPDDVHGDAEGGPTDVVEGDVRVLADLGADGPAEAAAQFGRVGVGVRVQADLPAVISHIAALAAQELGLGLRADDADGDAAAVADHLHRVGAESAGGAPDQDHVTLLHPGAVAADEHAVAAPAHRVTEAASSQVRWGGLATSWVARTTV